MHTNPDKKEYSDKNKQGIETFSKLQPYTLQNFCTDTDGSIGTLLHFSISFYILPVAVIILYNTIIVGNNHRYIKTGLPLPVMIKCQMPVVKYELPNDKYVHVYQKSRLSLTYLLMPSYFAPTLQPLSVAGE